MAKPYGLLPNQGDVEWILVNVNKEMCARNSPAEWMEMIQWIRDPSRPGWFGGVMTTPKRSFVTFSDPNTAFEFKLTYG